MADFIQTEAGEKGKEKSNRKRRAPRDHKAEAKKRALRYRNWVFTLNNPQEHGFPRFMKDSMVWLRYGEEVAPSTGTAHLQGVVHFRSKRVMPTDLYPWCRNAHWEHMGGSISSNLSYTGKEATAEAGTLHEFGIRPLSNKEAREKGGQATKERYKEIIKLAEDGKFDQIKEDYPGDFLRSFKPLRHIWEEAQQRNQPTNDLKHWWIVGGTGSGKSFGVFKTVGEENFYRKDANNKWWCGYAFERFVLIDDYQPLWKDRAVLKNWADWYPVRVEVKGGSMKVRPEHIIVTSNYSIADAHFEPDDIAPIKRRFKECSIEEFIEDYNMLYPK